MYTPYSQLIIGISRPTGNIKKSKMAESEQTIFHKNRHNHKAR